MTALTTALALVIGAVFVVPAPPAAAATDWTVGPEGDFVSLTAALASGSVISGDRLLVAPGDYSGSLVIDRNLVIEASGGQFTIQGTGGSVVTVQPGVGVSIIGAEIAGGTGTPELVTGCGGSGGPSCTRAKGGGVLNFGTLTLTGTRVADNVVDLPGDFVPNNGAGIYNEPGATLTVGSSSVIEDNIASYQGGGIYNAGGVVVIDSATIEGNGVINPGPLFLNRGGGVFTAGGSVTITNSGFFENVAERDGGALAVANGSVNVTDTEFGRADFTGGNSTLATNLGLGAVLFMEEGTVTFDRVTAKGNDAGFGGVASLNSAATFNVFNSTLSGNHARQTGGAITSIGSSLNVVNSTISSNTSAGDTGAIFSASGSEVTLQNATVYDNTAEGFPGGIRSNGGSTTLSNTVLAGNISDVSGTPITDDCSDDGLAGIFSSDGYNVFGDISRCQLTTTTGDQTGVTDPGLGPLFDHGGATPTHHPLPGSPVIDAGNPAAPGGGAGTCETLDQRGTARPAGSACDVGSVESIAPIQAAIDAAPAGGTVVVPSGTYPENLVIEKDLDLVADGEVTVDGGAAGPVVSVSGAIVLIDGLTLTNGLSATGGGISSGGSSLTLVDVELTGNVSTSNGGGLHHVGNELSITGATFSTNQATGNGGAIFTDTASLTSIADSTISDNESFDHGGGIYATGPLLVQDTVVELNRSGDFGGGINAVSSAFITGSLIGRNAASSRGGGLYATGGFEITHSTISGNVSFLGGGIADFGAGPSFMTDSTISGNLGADEGGGLYKAVAGSATLVNVTIADNDSAEGTSIGGGIAMAPAANGSLVLRSSLVADNHAATFPDCEGVVGGTFNLLGAGDTTGTAVPVEGCGLTGGVDGNQVGYLDSPIDPLLGPLAANGGSHLTHALLPGSPAIDAGNPAAPGTSEVGCTVLSQNGVDREAGGAGSCDIGAFESAAGDLISVAFVVDNPTPAAGVSSIPTSDVPAGALTAGSAANQGSVIANTEIGTIVDSPINSIPINSIPINSIPINSIPINSIAGQTLDSILLMDVPVEGGWESLLEGSSLTAPVQAYTFFDAISDDTVRQRIADRGIDLAGYGLAATPINSIPISAIALGATPINSIPINSIPINSIALVEAWCGLLEGSPADCDLIGVDPQQPASADGVNLVSLSLAAAPINSIPINSIPINSIPINSIPINSIPINSIYPQGTPINSILLVGAPINSIPINSIDLAASPINSIPINSIPINSIGAIIDCGVFDCAATGVTFGQVPLDAYIGTFGQLMHLLINETDELSGASLADILAGLPDETSFADLLALLMPPEEYPWQRMDLDASRLASFSTTPGTVQYTASLDLSTGTPLNDVAVTVTLPPGFTYVPGSTSYLPAAPPGAPADPVIDGSLLSWSIPGIADLSTLDLSFAATTGLRLGPVATGLDATLPGAGGVASASATTSIVEAFEPNDTVAQATVAAVDNIYVTHISSGTDLDFYRLENVTSGSVISADLAGLPADYDLVIYGPPQPPLRGEPERAVIGVEDGPLDLLAPDESQPEVIEDIVLADLPVVALSTNRGGSAERVTTAPLASSGDYVIQVSGYNGATSTDPYTLRLSVEPGTGGDACTAVPPSGGTPGSLPGALPSGVNTLFLFNQQRYEATHGAAALDDLLAALGAVADQPDLGVIGAVIPVEGDPAVATAYSSLDDEPCSVEAANGVASAIAGLVDGYRDANPDIDYVVIVGGDDQVPQFRLRDETRIANETGYTSALRGAVTPQTAALAAGTFLSDDPYGDANPLLANGREIFVPEIAMGRLVETPAEIVGTLERFLTFNGLLDPTTTTSAFVSGYDFLSDGSEAVAAELADTGRPITSLISEVWNRDGLIAGWLDGTHTVASVNAHFDHNRAQPAALDSGFLTTGDVTGSGAGTLERAIVFSMGCHSGLNFPDVQIGGDPLAADWAQTLSGQGATFVGNTGYGYGETDTVALSEDLLRRFAGNLDGGLTVGQALQIAKQHYAGSSLVYGAYDDKVLMISTFYGLPFYRVGGGGEPVPTPTPPPLGFDNVVGLPTSIIDTALDIGTSLVIDTGDRGSFYAHVGEDGLPSTQVTPFRPIQPKIAIDITQGGGLVAHGALITGLQSTDITPFDPVVARPVVDLGANEPEPIAPGVFPSALQTVNRFATAAGDRDQLILVPGQFRSTTATTGIQRLFTGINTTVFYGPATGDFTPPVIISSTATEGAGTVTFTVDVEDAAGEVRKVTVLFQDAAGSGTWTEVVLVQGADGSWSGAAAAAPGEKEFFVQAVDDSGNVAVSSNKGELFLSRLATPPSGGLVALAGDLVDGWYTGTATVTLTPPPGGVVAYELDGSALVPYTGPFDVIGEGVHTLIAYSSTGDSETITIPIDAEPPVITSPIQGAVFTTGQVVLVDFACSDAASGVASCESTLALESALPTGASGSFQVTAIDGTGKSTTETISYTVVGTPIATIVGDPGTVNEGTVVAFSSGTPGATSWSWTATREGGLVATGAGQTFAFTADDDGAYQVSLNVMVGSAASAPATVSFTAENIAPTIGVTGEESVDVGTPYTIVLGPVVDPGTDNAFAYDLNWGDGTVETVDRLGPFSHTYTAPGSVSISVDVTDEDGSFPDAGAIDLVVTEPGPPMCRGQLATIVGTPGDDVINGTSRNDVIVGGGGNDIINGGAGNDVICGGDGNDTIDGGSGNDTIDTGAGDNAAEDGSGNDTIIGGDGADQIDSGSGNDTISSGGGEDTILAGTGNDVIEAGEDADQIDGGSGNDTIHAGGGNDVVEGQAGNDTIFGDEGNDVIAGGSGNDQLFGGAGDDQLDGGPGNDRLDGGPGFDMLNGASGRDQCVNGDVLLACED